LKREDKDLIFGAESAYKRSLGRKRLRWTGNVKQDLRGKDKMRIKLAQDIVKWRTLVLTGSTFESCCQRV
jgi:3-deoxy-D-manno-octulosonic-acid transferase